MLASFRRGVVLGFGNLTDQQYGVEGLFRHTQASGQTRHEAYGTFSASL